MNKIEDVINRSSWDEYFKELVKVTSTRSSCSRLKVGCLFVKDNRIISQGYNGYIQGFKHEPLIENNHNIATIHAEQNAILDCAKRGVSSYNCTAYITHTPCFTCTKLMIGAGIKQIKYITDYNIDNKIYDLANEGNIKIIKLDI